MSKTERDRATSGCAIILEGADASGKTTVAKAIAAFAMDEGADFVYLHGSPWPGTVFKEHIRMALLTERAVQGGAIVVLDHFWIAEQMYGPHYRGHAAYDPSRIEQEMRGLGAVVCLCVPNDLEAQIERHAVRRAKGQEHFDEARGIVERYAALAGHKQDGKSFADVWKGGGSLERVAYEQTFWHRDDSHHYDMDRHSPELFAKRLVNGARNLRQLRGHQNKSVGAGR